MSEILWQPDPQQSQGSAMARFMARMNQEHGLSLENYADLHAWSVSEREKFWECLLEFADIHLHHRGKQTLDANGAFWQHRWFPDTRLNYAENLLQHRDDRLALRFFDEAGNQQSLSYAQLYDEVRRISNALRAHGIQPGDRVAGFAANRMETVIAMLATTAIGAVWSSCSPDFGANGIIDRFQQIEPRVLFAVSSHLYAGRINRHEATLSTLLQALPTLELLVLFPDLYASDQDDSQSLANKHGHCEVRDWAEIKDDPEAPMLFHSSAFNDPLFIMYSSGTTGIPKCIIHGTGGTLLQHRKEHLLHVDMHADDVFFYFTTCGWMMWNWLVSGLASGATLILFDGSPFHPHPARLFQLAEETGISVFGVSAKYLSACEKTGLHPAREYQLDRMRTLLSTGSPLPAQGFDYVYGNVSSRVALQSISGGTDIISCFVLGNPLLPVYRGEIQCAGLGMDVAILDEAGQEIIGSKGELVCRQSFPSMPVGFWNDPGQEKYRKSYFKRFPGIWTHGDFAEQTDRGTYIIYGRSDTVLNPGGVRIGTAEIYRQVEKLEDILESVAVGRQLPEDVEVVLFVRLQPGISLDAELEGRIRQSIRAGASPRHVPARILAVSDIPRTLSGKIAELAVRDTLNGSKPDNLDALANPESLVEYEQHAARLRS